MPIDTTKPTLNPLVLLVEDEAMIRLMAVDLLNDIGFSSIEAASAKEAMTQLASAPSGLVFIMVDIGLPDQPGADVAAQIRNAYPALPVLIATGQLTAALKARFQSDPLVGFLGKPYTGDMLSDALKTLGIPHKPAGSTP